MYYYGRYYYPLEKYANKGELGTLFRKALPWLGIGGAGLLGYGGYKVYKTWSDIAPRIQDLTHKIERISPILDTIHNVSPFIALGITLGTPLLVYSLLRRWNKIIEQRTQQYQEENENKPVQQQGEQQIKKKNKGKSIVQQQKASSPIVYPVGNTNPHTLMKYRGVL